MAGGTDLIVEIRKGELQPSQVIDIKNIPGLNHMEMAHGELLVGTLVKIQEIAGSKIIREKFAILSQAAGSLGSPQVRNKATIGGNLCQAAPSADMPPALIGLGAVVRFVGRSGEKTLRLEDFFLGAGQTALQEGEILTQLIVPDMPAFSEGVYLKFGPRRAMDLALVAVATVLELDADLSRCVDAKVVLGGVGPTPIRAKKAEEAIKGARLSPTSIEKVARIARDEAKPSTRLSARVSEWYRKEIVEVLVKRSFYQITDKLHVKRAGGKQAET